MPRMNRRLEATPEDMLHEYWDHGGDAPIEEVRGTPVRIPDYEPPVDLRELSTVNQTEPSDLWGAYSNNRRYIEEETQRLVNSMVVGDVAAPIPETSSGTYTLSVGIDDVGRAVVNNQEVAHRIYSIDESIEPAIPVPANVDRRCVVRADRRQGIESVKTE